MTSDRCRPIDIPCMRARRFDKQTGTADFHEGRPRFSFTRSSACAFAYFEPLPEEPAPVVPPPVLVPLPVSREPEPLLLVPVPEPPLGEEASRSLDDEPEEPDEPDREPAVWASSSLPPVMDMTCCLCCWSLGRIAVANCFTSWSFAFFDFSEYAATPFAWLTFM